ncbi:MAG: RdgB/HAM1 family non-canonical purine NTP pyrophosphatase [Terriglobales bacterium]
MREILIATLNQGKLRDFAAVAAEFGVSVAAVPGLATVPPAPEDAPTFEANACKKAEYYSRLAPHRYVMADDSGLQVDALRGAPGVHSARYAARQAGRLGHSTDEENNARLLQEMAEVPEEQRGANFVCSIAVARDGKLAACFRGVAHGRLLRELRGNRGFGYDPLFFIPEANATFAELSPEHKAKWSHRGQAFRKFLKWYAELPEEAQRAPGVAR